MDQHIQDDLKGLVKGELFGDDISRRLYSTDASIFQVQPLGVVVPRDEDDVRAVVRYAAEHNLSLTPRGAGTGMAGESLTAGLVLDLSQHFRAILDVGTDTVRVQPGVVLRDLNNRLARDGRRFAPDPASGGQCTLGGMIATNASGARTLRHGYTRDHVVSLRVVLDTGEVVDAARPSRWPAADTTPGRFEDIVSSTVTLLAQHTELIRTCQPKTPFNRCAYLLHDILGEDHLDLARLLVGTEGTLAVTTEATLRTVPLPGGRSLVLASFATLENALRAVQRVVPTGPSACELIDRRLLSLARGRARDPAAASLVHPAAEAMLIVEYEAESEREARRLATDLAQSLYRGQRLAIQALTAWEPEEVDRFWSVREAALPSLFRLRGEAQPIPLVEDIGVPPEALGDYLRRAQELLKRHEVTAAFLVHAATGQVHTRPFLDLQKPEDSARLWALAEDVCSLALELGGTVSTQHGTGIARTPWVARQYGALYPVFRDLKAIFDPRHVFNPGKIIGPADGQPMWPLRSSVPSTEYSVLSTQLRWQPNEMWAEGVNCNGCGHCRTESPALRMCPIFRATLAEPAAPRAKANLIRELFAPETGLPPLSSDAVRAVADLCVNCKMCAQECPARVNVPKLMLEAKAANVAEHGMSRGDWVLSRAESFAWLGSALAPLVNAGFDSRTVRWLLERVFGVSRHRRLPTFSAHNFLHRAKRRGWTRRPRAHRSRVAYFVDVFANYNDPLIGEATAAVLHHHGIEVYVPPGQRGCGMAPLAYGDVELARDTVLHNLRLLADLAREGFPILCSEPTAALMLRHDALDLTDDDDAQLVAERTVELTAFLWDLHRERRLRTDFRRLDLAVGHHVPCHLKALGGTPRGPALLALIPGMRVHTIDVSCSGMAGTFGLGAENYETSLAAGRPMLDELERPRVLFGSTECSTCRMQMEDGTGKRTLHPVQYLAMAYGLVPELRRRLREPIGDLVLK